jgi:hypothetical protein
MSRVGEQAVVVVMAIISVAVLAVIVSKNANTTGVISAVAQGFSQALGAATAPITGGSMGIGGF